MQNDLIENHPLRSYERHLTPSEIDRIRGELIAAKLGHQLAKPHHVTQRILNDRVRMSLHDVVRWGQPLEKQRSWSSSDFTQLLEAAQLHHVPRGVPKPEHRAFCPVQQVRDFKEHWAVTGADGLELIELAENSEAQQSDKAPMADGLLNIESGKVKTYHRRIAVSRALAITADASDWLKTIPRAMTAAAYRREASEVYAALEANPVMSDGRPWFVANENEAGAAVPVVDAVKTLLDLFSAQKLANGELLGLAPKVLVVPSADAINQLSAGAARLLERMGISVVIRSGLTHAYCFADPAENRVFELLALNEDGAPLIEALTPSQAKDSRDVAAIFSVVHDFAPLPLSRYGVVRAPIA